MAESSGEFRGRRVVEFFRFPEPRIQALVSSVIIPLQQLCAARIIRGSGVG